MEIPSSYTISKFMQYAGKPTSNRSYYNGSCPICREGKHWQKKKRLFYFPSTNYLYCHNCFAGEQTILTLEHGIVPFAEIKNKTVTIKAKDGIWRKAKVQSYGNQPVFRYTLGGCNNNAKIEYDVLATANHKWFVKLRRKDKQGIGYKTTTTLTIGNNLYSESTIEKEDIDGVIHGIIFGDGTYRKYKGKHRYAIIRVCKKDSRKDEILKYFKQKNYNITFPPNLKGDAYINLGAIAGLKELPKTTNPSYISGFIKGWWLADGQVATSKFDRLYIDTTRHDAIEWIKHNAPLAGYRFSSYNISKNRKCYANGKPLLRFALSIKSDVKVRNKVYEKTEEVFCVEEPISGGFYLGNGLLTGNCSRSWSPYFWIKEVSGMTYHEIIADMKDYMGDDINYSFVNTSQKEEEIFQIPDLPGECVNLSDPTQVKFYKNNKIVQLAFNYCKQRRLFTAINAPKSIFVCIEDTFHKNRLVIPYYQNNKIVCYVTRQLLDTDTKAKYLIKFNADKPLFNFEKIDVNYPYIFIIEGPIDSMFLKNSTSITGIHLTAIQEKLLTSSFPLHEQIWVYDNPKFEDAIVVKKITDKLKAGEKVFLYDGDLAEFKDLNAYCTQKNLDFVNPDLIVAGSYTGNVGLMKIN